MPDNAATPVKSKEETMAYMASGAFPVLPGKADRVRNFGKEVAAHQAEWERLCRECRGFTHFNVTLQDPDNNEEMGYVSCRA